MKKCIILVTILFLSQMSSGQAFSSQVPDFFRSRIKSIDEFMERFNGEKLPSNLDSTDVNLSYKNKIACFFRDSVVNRADEVIEFAYKMVDSNILLSFGDPDYFCELHCNAHYAGKKTSIIIRMVVEQDERGYYSWAIADAEGDVLRMIPERKSPSTKLSPIDNMQHFSELQEMLHNSYTDIPVYLHKDVSMDQTSVFVSLVSANMLKVDEINEMIYIFNKGGYVFKVKFFNNKTLNSGWLIYDFKKV